MTGLGRFIVLIGLAGLMFLTVLVGLTSLIILTGLRGLMPLTFLIHLTGLMHRKDLVGLTSLMFLILFGRFDRSYAFLSYGTSQRKYMCFCFEWVYGGWNKSMCPLSSSAQWFDIIVCESLVRIVARNESLFRTMVRDVTVAVVSNVSLSSGLWWGMRVHPRLNCDM